MVFRKKKKGSTMVTVMAVFGILTLVGTVTLSLTYSGFKVRNLESKKIENQYSAESGIDESKKIIEVAVDTAIKKANLDVYKETTKINEMINKVKKESDGTYSGIKSKIDNIVQSNEENYEVFLKNEFNTSYDESNIYYYYSDDGNNNPIIKIDDLSSKQNYCFSISFKKL